MLLLFGAIDEQDAREVTEKKNIQYSPCVQLKLIK